MAPRAMNLGGGEPSLASLIERSAELKRTLVDFALSPRFERHLEQFMLEAADPYQELSEGEAIGVIDRFALQHRLPNGKTMLDQFLDRAAFVEFFGGDELVLPPARPRNCLRRHRHHLRRDPRA